MYVKKLKDCLITSSDKKDWEKKRAQSLILNSGTSLIRIMRIATQFRVKIFVLPNMPSSTRKASFRIPFYQKTCTVWKNIKIFPFLKKKERRNCYLGVAKVADLEARRRAAIQQRVLQLQIPVANLLRDQTKHAILISLTFWKFYT